MATKHFCDVCGKETEYSETYSNGQLFGGKQYCESCWTDKKNWPAIHKIEKEED